MDLIRARLSLRSMAEQAGAVFRNKAYPCILHGGGNPTAFSLYENETRWHCVTRCPQGCNDGDIFDFYMRWKHVDFPTALLELASRAGLTLAPLPKVHVRENFHNPVPTPIWTHRAQQFVDYAARQPFDTETGAPARAYLFSERGLTCKTYYAFNLGYNPRDLYDSPDRWGFPPNTKKIWLPHGIVIPGDNDPKLC